MRWTIPNILTVMRLLAAPALVAVYEVFPRPFSDWIALSLFVAAALTDFLDGYLARRWRQITAFGRMLDPIADKAMTIIALVLLVALFRGMTVIIVPATLIIFREVFVSGLREFLGADAGKLQVTQLAKWKTTVQMVAIAILFSNLLFEHYFYVQSFAMEQQTVDAILAGQQEDLLGIKWKFYGYGISKNLGIIFLWLSAALTVVTGFDYLIKALPFLKDGEK